MGEVIDGVFEVINSEQLEALMETNNELLTDIEHETSRFGPYLMQINESLDNIEGYISTGFFLLCITLTITLIIKTFFTGW